MLKENHKLFLILIIGLAILLRFINPLNVPPSLNWDEASLGYNAYSILKTGRDEWGRAFPLTFEAFGDYKLPGYIYLSIPFIAIFGLNELSVRLLSQIAGVLAVVLIYLIAGKIFKDNKFVALSSALLLAISPWHLFFSRAALEANLAFTLFLAAFYFFLKGLEKRLYLIFSAFLLGLTIFTYNSARIFIPLFLIPLILIHIKELKSNKKSLILPAVILGIFILVAGYLAIFEDSSSRYYWVSIIDQGAINYLNEARNSSVLPPIVSKLVFNRYVYFGQVFVQNYLSYFSLEFLFLKGGTNYQFSVPNIGILYLFELPLLILGLIKLWTNKYATKLLLFWLFLAPLPASITREAPHVLRSVFMLGSIQIIGAYGLYNLYKFIKIKKGFKNLFWPILLFTFLFSTTFYFYNYFVVYPKQNSQSWQYGYQQVVDYLVANQGKYSKIYFSKRYGEPHIFYLFYSKYDPAKYQNNSSLMRYSRTNWRWVDRLDNIYFINDWEVKDKLKNEESALLISSPGEIPKKGKIIKTIYFLDGSKAFNVVSL